MVKAICQEIEARSAALDGHAIRTIYFGGGTPSVLTVDQLSAILDGIRNSFVLDPDLELTLEANPEDIDHAILLAYQELGVNRLSMGIQSFDDQILKSMNRSHDSVAALSAVRAAQQVGIDNITVDLIYGLPGKSGQAFEDEVTRFLDLEVPHISAYALTIEEGTLYHHQVKNGTLTMPSEEIVEEQFFLLRKRLSAAGYEHYEVSNYGMPGFISKHNSAYWKGVPYLGFGPSAHSYDGSNRSWNVANNHLYMKSVEEGKSMIELESLDTKTRYNEYLLTRLRTKWGIDLDHVKQAFGVDILASYQSVWSRYEGRYTISDGHLILDPEGLILADGLASDLFQIA